jgi:Zn-dependent protease
LDPGLDLGDAAAWYIAFVLSTTAHEAAHALAAYLGGDPTAYEGGQVSLNPVPHMQREPIGMVVVPLLSALWSGWSFGWASTPYDPLWEQRHPKRAAWMAAAGPAANLTIAALCLVALRIGIGMGTFEAPELVSYSFLVTAATPFAENLGRFLGILLVLNSILCVFNLMPVPPLDGASALGLVLPEEVALRFKEMLGSGGVGSLLFLLVFLFFGRIFVSPIWNTILELVHPGLYVP